MKLKEAILNCINNNITFYVETEPKYTGNICTKKIDSFLGYNFYDLDPNMDIVKVQNNTYGKQSATIWIDTKLEPYISYEYAAKKLDIDIEAIKKYCDSNEPYITKDDLTKYGLLAPIKSIELKDCDYKFYNEWTSFYKKIKGGN